MNDYLYYEVIAKCGHVGRNNYILNMFPVRAKSKKEAAKRARNFPRVKHDQKDAIKSVREISYEEYLELMEQYQLDAYNFAHSRQEQSLNCGYELYERVEKESIDDEVVYTKVDSIKRRKKLYKLIIDEFKKDIYTAYSY